jgi:hypothetical protein
VGPINGVLATMCTRLLQVLNLVDCATHCLVRTIRIAFIERTSFTAPLAVEFADENNELSNVYAKGKERCSRASKIGLCALFSQKYCNVCPCQLSFQSAACAQSASSQACSHTAALQSAWVTPGAHQVTPAR